MPPASTQLEVMMDLMLALTAANQAATLVKGLREIDRSLSEGEIKAAMADLYGKLADVKMALSDAQLELRERDTTIRELQEAMAFKEDLVRIGSFHYRRGADGQATGAPFCPACEAKLGKFVTLTRGITVNSSPCPSCKAAYGRDAVFHSND